MKRQRGILLLAAMPIVLASVSLSNWAHSDPHASASWNLVRSDVSSDSLYTAGRSDPAMTAAKWSQLCTATNRTAQRWQGRLGPKFHTQVRTPFVMAGNLSDEQLIEWYDSTIAPAAAAMSRDLLQTVPDHPITVLLFSDEAIYRRFVRDQLDQEFVSIYGFYKPSRRILVINLQAGGGTIVHELTHALIDFDFPDIPIWLNEGLGSLHEQCNLVMTDLGPMIAPLVNWRLPILQEAIMDGQLPSLRELMLTADMHGRDEAKLYAQARYFCLFLHQRGLLPEFYRTLRARVADDPRGVATLAEFFSDTEFAALNDQFRRWAMSLHWK